MEEFTKSIAHGIAEGQDKLLIEFLKGVLSIEVESCHLPNHYPTTYFCIDGKRRYQITQWHDERAMKMQGKML